LYISEFKSPGMEKRICLECGEALHGRADQKFCSDACRTAYHNRTHADRETIIRKINSILRRNRNILMRLNPTGKVKVSREKLIREGFNFSYHTNTYRTKNGNTYYYCYDQGYLPLADGIYFLVRRQEYVDQD